MKNEHQTNSNPLLKRISQMVACHDMPKHPPQNPMPLLLDWYNDAKDRGRYDDFNAMSLATATVDGRPSVRVVLCKAIEPERDALVFYTSYKSRKGEELEANPAVAAVFHWPHAKRQARVEGTVQRTTPEESDAYFQTRPLLSRIGATISPQSRAIESRESVIAEVMRVGRSVIAGSEVTRPDHWGGYRILLNRVELWSARSGRLHDRVVWTKESPAGSWQSRRLGA